MEEKKSVLQDFKEKTAGMNFGQKLGYFWTYYKLPTIVAAFILFVIITIAGGMIRNALTKPVLNIGVINDVDLYLHDDLQKAAEQTFPENAGFHKPVLSSFFSPADTKVLYASTQLMAYLSGDELDALICDMATVDYCINSDLPLTFEDISSSPVGEVAQAVGLDHLYYVVLTDSANKEAAEKFLPVLKVLGSKAEN